MKPIVITITSNKGGVGKTTTAAALCDIYRKEYPVLLIDTDPQCNCAAKFGFEVPVDRGRLGDMLIDMVQDHLKHKPFVIIWSNFRSNIFNILHPIRIIHHF